MNANLLLNPNHQRCCFEVDLPERWDMQHGGYIQQGKLAYSLYGDTQNPCILVLGGISSGRYVSNHPTHGPGWWQKHVGHSSSICLQKFCVLGIDYLGGNGESSSPYHRSHPVLGAVTTHDQAKAILYLLDHLNIRQLAAAVGSSYGGMVLLSLIEQNPLCTQQAIIISAAHKSCPHSTAIRAIQRQMVRFAQSHNDPKKGLELARGLAMLTYRTKDEFQQRFTKKNHMTDHGFEAEAINYLSARGKSFSKEFNADAFCCLSESIDLHHSNLSEISTPLTCVAVNSDQLIPLALIQELSEKTNANFITIDSLYGHDAFLKEDHKIRQILQHSLQDSTHEPT